MNKVKVGLVSEPGLPTKLAQKVVGRLSGPLTTSGDSVDIAVETVESAPDLDVQGVIEIVALAQTVGARKDWDVTLFLTSLPRHGGSDAVAAELVFQNRAAVVSLPAMGVSRLTKKTEHLIRHVLKRLLEGDAEADNKSVRLQGYHRRLTPVQNIVAQEDGIDLSLGFKGVLGKAALLGGMVRDNRPWRLVPGLSTSLASAVAGGAFGLFYSALWQNATHASLPRLAAITLASISIYVVWLVVSHGLWERKSEQGTSLMKHLYNASTVLTLLTGTAFMYAALFSFLFGAGLVVISPTLLEQSTQQEADVTAYLRVAWMASSLGMFAGAVGSGVESAADVRDAAYGTRERQRRAKAEKEAGHR